MIKFTTTRSFTVTLERKQKTSVERTRTISKVLVAAKEIAKRITRKG